MNSDSVAAETRPSICRLCLAYCPIEVEVRDGKAVKVAGDRTGTPWNGYICPKGRALPEQHNGAHRLLRPLRRAPEGTAVPVASDQAIRQVAAKLQAIVREHGPEAVAFYIGTGVVSNPTGQTIAVAFMRALGSGMIFSASTIDKPGANVSTALHGNWIAGAHRMEDSDAWMIVGGNPVIAKSNGAPPNNPGIRLKEAVGRGMTLIVIDPRVTETAKRAKYHLQVRPGEDPALLAGMLHVIIEEGLADRDFVDRHADGFETLRAAVAPFTPDYVAARAGIDRDALIGAARDFARAKIASAVCSTGPSFATRSTLSFYLALCLNSVCGHWPREGQPAPFPNILLPAYRPKAQAYPPYPAIGSKTLSATGLRQNASGLPTAGLADQILDNGPNGIRALLCVGGNPVLSWPDQARTEKAMAALDLLVVFDYKLTATAEFAHYVVPPPLTLEIPGHSQMVEWLKYIGVTRGMSMPWAQYTPAIVPKPSGSDLMDEGEFLFRIAREMGLQLDLVFTAGHGPHVEAPTRKVSLDMSAEPPGVEELLDLACADSRIPLDEVRSHPHGRLFDQLSIAVEPADPGNRDRLQLADPLMMEELVSVLAAGMPVPGLGSALSLLCRRVNHFMNSMGQGLPALGSTDNPLSMHPADMARLGIGEGQKVEIRSAAGAAEACAASDSSLRQGCVSITHGFGGRMAAAAGSNGTSVARLVDLDEADPITGIPRMSGIPVVVSPLERDLA
jgi:anaerobic selenocysteine-containing dehydrogenase